MIYLSSSAVMVVNRDGTKTSFDPEELQAKLINSCIASGIKDYWLAEDISNAVESALSFQSENGIIFSDGEVNSFILKILEDTGYPEIAENFKKNNNIIADLIMVSNETVRKLFESRLGLKSKDLNIVSERVLNACDILHIKETEPSLLIELGRYYKTTDIKKPNIDTLRFNGSIAKSPWVLSQDEIHELISQETRFFVQKNVLSISGISNLFPSLKIDIRLEPLAQLYDLKPIITELILFPCYKQSADAVYEIISKSSKILKLKKIIPDDKILPVYLRFSDIYSFAKEYLGARYPEADDFFWNSLAAGFVENINHPIFVKGIKIKKKTKL